MILTRHGGQELLDALSAISLGASALVVARFGPASALRSRLSFVFGGLCFFFATRASIGAFGYPFLVYVNQLVACVMPLAALLLVEGATRTHAPKALKAFATFGAAAVAIGLLLPISRNVMTVYGLGIFVVLSLLCATALLVARDRSALSRQENAGLDALAVPGTLVTLLTVSDFLPSAPVGLSGVGAAMLAFVIAANPSSREEARGVLSELLLVACVAAASELGFAATFGIAILADHLRLGATLLALLLAAAAVLRVRQARDERFTRSFPRALALADTSSVDGFLSSLADQPLLAGLRLAEPAQLGEYDHEVLGAAFAARPVWTRAMLSSESPDATALAREELSDLMTRTDATHAVMISRTPLRIALFTLPGVGQSDFAETDLALFGKLAAIAAGGQHARG